MSILCASARYQLISGSTWLTMQVGTPLSMDTPTKSSGNTDQGFLKKLKGFDGLAMSIGNGNAESTEHGNENRLSNSRRRVDLLFPSI